MDNKASLVEILKICGKSNRCILLNFYRCAKMVLYLCRKSTSRWRFLRIVQIVADQVWQRWTVKEMSRVACGRCKVYSHPTICRPAKCKRCIAPYIANVSRETFFYSCIVWNDMVYYSHNSSEKQPMRLYGKVLTNSGVDDTAQMPVWVSTNGICAVFILISFLSLIPIAILLINFLWCGDDNAVL